MIIPVCVSTDRGGMTFVGLQNSFTIFSALAPVSPGIRQWGQTVCSDTGHCFVSADSWQVITWTHFTTIPQCPETFNRNENQFSILAMEKSCNTFIILLNYGTKYVPWFSLQYNQINICRKRDKGRERREHFL